MKGAIKWTMVLALLLLTGLQLDSAWGQLRTQSGSLARKSGIKHPKELERQVFKLTNEARRKNGLPSLDLDETLTATARQHSDDMLQRDFFSHTSPDGKDLRDRLLDAPAVVKSIARAGENIYGGSGQDCSDTRAMSRVIVDGWMTSPGHRANILNPDYTHLGVGVSVRGKDIRATQNFSQNRKAP